MTVHHDPLIEEVQDDPKRPYKALASAAVAAVGTFIAYWVADADPFTSKDAGEAFLAALIASGATGGLAFAVPNPIVRKRGIPPTTPPPVAPPTGDPL